MRRMIAEGERELRKLVESGQADLNDLWRSAKQRVGSGADTSEELRALEVMPDEVKLLYTKAVVAQALIDGEADPREVASVYVFASRIDLNLSSRREVRRYLSGEELEGEDGLPEILNLTNEILATVHDNEREVVASALVKDLLWISRADGTTSSTERASVEAVAREHFGDRADEAVRQSENTIHTEEAYVRGEISVSEFEKRMKQAASQAAAIGLPVAAIYFSGSVVGLSAAGFTSGLAALGLGGVLGLSSMLTGLGVVIIGGVAVYQLARWTLGVNERENAKRREHMIQEVLRQHQKSMADLAQDIGEKALLMEEYTDRSDRNAERLSRLKSELQMFKAALATLQVREEDLKDKEEQFAT
jgi:hypothetical protein